MKVANLAQSGCRGICQHPLDAPSFEKYREPASLGEISSRVGNTNLTCTLQGTIQLSKIDANPWLSNVLRYWYHRCTPFTWLCYSFDDTRFSSSSTFGTGIRGKAMLLVGLNTLRVNILMSSLPVHSSTDLYLQTALPPAPLFSQLDLL